MKQFMPSLFILLLGVVIFTTGCGGSQGQQAVAQAAPPEEEKVVPVEVAVAQRGQMALVLDYAGTLEAKDSLNIMPGANGRIESVMIETGDEVQAGDPIAIIEDDTYLAQLKQAEVAVTSARLNLAKMELGSRPEEIAAAQAAVELARAALNDVATINDDERTRSVADLARAEAELKAAQSEYDKIAWAGDVGQTPQAIRLQQATIAYQNALARYNLDTNPSDSQLAPLMLQQAQAELALALKLQPYRQIDFEAARAAIQQAEAALELANIQLGEVVIKAPFDGIVAELNISQGSRVSPQTNVASFISKEIEVVVNVPENRIGQIKEGQNAALQMTAYPGQSFPGVVSSIAPVANKDTRTFEVKITPTKGADLLHSGMYANVSILAEEKQNTLLAPRTAVFDTGNQPLVYVVNDDNTVEQRPVSTGLFDKENIEILSGLKPGETVVTAGQSNLTDGAKVELTNDPRIAK
ncbi:MAG: efflux RND transporter periplasmic adaptor subunit [Anaerolineales bacterium]|nr:efflux RND transporter periplasmic adaptor subunit [Anaerolineales bacterium]